MIIRLMGEGQYEVDYALLEELNVIDAAAAAALEEGEWWPLLDGSSDGRASVCSIAWRGGPRARMGANGPQADTNGSD